MKKITLSDIKSGILIGQPEKATVFISVNGEQAEFKTYIKPFSYDTAVATFKAMGEKKEALAGTLASCICDKDGNLTFTEDEIRKNFNQHLVNAIWDKIVEINVLGKTSKSLKKKKSSVRLLSPQDGQSKKQENSRTEKSEHGQPTDKKEEV